MNGKKYAAISVASVAAVVVAIAAHGGQQPARAASSHHHASAAAVSPAASYDPCIAAGTWDPSALKAVQADLSAIGTDASNGDLLAMPAAGQALAAQAAAASQSPPPVDGGQYTGAMNDYTIAGSEIASGQYAEATVATNDGSAGINAVTAAINRQCG